MKIPESTVRKIVKENRNKKEFAEVCAQKKEDFAVKSTEIINKGLLLLNKRFDSVDNSPRLNPGDSRE